jgi:hypothetical protein
MATVNKNLDGNTEWSSAGHAKRGLVSALAQGSGSPDIEGLGGARLTWMAESNLTAGDIGLQIKDSSGNYHTVTNTTGIFQKVSSTVLVGYMAWVPSTFRFIASNDAASGTLTSHEVYYEIHKVASHDRGRH